MAHDTYLRLTPVDYRAVPRSRIPVAARSSRPEGVLTFVDTPPSVDVNVSHRVLGWWRNLPLGTLAGTEYLLVRKPDMIGMQAAEDAAAAFEPSGISEFLRTSLGIDVPHVGVVEFPLEAAPVVRWDTPPPRSSSGDLLARCRAIELETLLRRADAIWEPRTYHYRLPSGHHANSFVRLADAFVDPRATGALSTWLRAGARRGGVIVVDSGTLAPVLTHVLAEFEKARL